VSCDTHASVTHGRNSYLVLRSLTPCRRVALAERETALQRWAAALGLTAAQQGAGGAALAALQQEVRHTAFGQQR
jgi:hypothetical protein